MNISKFGSWRFTVKRIRTHRVCTHMDSTSDQVRNTDLSLMITEENR